MNIGITCSHDDENNLTEVQQERLEYYRLAVEDAGGDMKVLFLPQNITSPTDLRQMAEEWCDHLQGLIVSGGADLPPELYNATPDPKLETVVPKLRPALEKELVDVMLQQQKPVLGICYGVQLLTVMEGGSLIQDIPSHIPNAIDHRSGMNHKLHKVHTEPGSRLQELLGTSFEVASFHHQAIDKIAPTAQLAALAPDGVIEAVEFPNHRFCIGVQWHPERTRESETTKKLMKAFVDACR